MTLPTGWFLLHGPLTAVPLHRLCHACYGQATASLPVLNGLRKVAVLGTATCRAKAAARARDLMLMLLELFSQGITGHAALARALNQRMVSAPWGGQ